MKPTKDIRINNKSSLLINKNKRQGRPKYVQGNKIQKYFSKGIEEVKTKSSITKIGESDESQKSYKSQSQHFQASVCKNLANIIVKPKSSQTTDEGKSEFYLQEP